MFSSNSAKIFFVFASLFSQACGFWRGQTDATTSPAPFAAEELKSAIPFSTKEPEIYQTEIVVTANGIEDVTFTARNGTKRLTIFDFQTESETAVLELGENQTFLIAPQRRIYALEKFGSGGAETAEFFTAELLNQKKDARFEPLGAENNLVRYLVSLDEARHSEIIVSVDEKIGLPVKQEFYSIGDDAQRILTSAVELRNYSLQTDAKFFEIPKDYRKVSAREFREKARQTKLK